MKNKELYPLIIDMKKKDVKAFEAIYNQLWDTVYYLAYYYLGNQENAKDVTQEAFITIYNKIDNLKNEMAFNSWMNRIIINLCHDYQKSKSHDYDIELFDNSIEVMEENIGLMPKELLDNKNKQEDVIEAINKLPMKLKSVVLLYFFEEMSLREIAATLDIALGTVHKRLVKAQGILNEALEQDYSISKSTMVAGVLTTILQQNSRIICTESIKNSIFINIKPRLNIYKFKLINNTLVKITISVAVVSVVAGGYILTNDNQKEILPTKNPTTNIEPKVEKDYSKLEDYVGKANADLIKSWKTRSAVNNSDLLIRILKDNGIKQDFYYIEPDTNVTYVLYSRKANQYTLLLGERYDTYNKEWNVVYQIINDQSTIDEAKFKDWFLSLE